MCAHAYTWEWTWHYTCGGERLPSPVPGVAAALPPAFVDPLSTSPLSSECNPAHLTFLVSSLELGSSGLPVSAYLFTEPSPWPILCNHLWLGDKNCVFNSYYGVWSISSHLNVLVSVSLSQGGVWSSANPHHSETSETYFF